MRNPKFVVHIRISCTDISNYYSASNHKTNDMRKDCRFCVLLIASDTSKPHFLAGSSYRFIRWPFALVKRSQNKRQTGIDRLILIDTELSEKAFHGNDRVVILNLLAIENQVIHFNPSFFGRN